MAKTKPQWLFAQAYDVTQVREYYKTKEGFLFSSNVLVKADTIKDWIEWKIVCDSMPDKITINGKSYNLKQK